MPTSRSEKTYEVFRGSGVPIKSWTLGVPFEPEARAQLERVAELPFIHKWVAAMPDVHHGKGATVGSVIPTQGAIIPQPMSTPTAAGMMAPCVGITLPTVAPLPRCTSGMAATHW